MASNFAANWDKAKKEFEAATGKKKPKESKGIFNAFGAHTGLSGSLKATDKGIDDVEKAISACKSDADIQASKPIAKLLDELAKEAKKFATAKTGYVSVLEKEMGKEFAARPDKDTKSLYEKCLKSLKKELDAIEATVQSRVSGFKIRVEQAGSITQQMQANFEKNWSAVIARAKAAVGKIKADPTPKTWNTVFPKAARDVTMQLGIAKTMGGWQADPDGFARPLMPFANQKGEVPSVLPPDTAADAVLTHLKTFTTGCKNAEAGLVKAR